MRDSLFVSSKAATAPPVEPPSPGRPHDPARADADAGAAVPAGADALAWAASGSGTGAGASAGTDPARHQRCRTISRMKSRLLTAAPPQH
jgi:hypothetical protein